LEQAIQDSRYSAERLRLQKQERLRVLNELHTNSSTFAASQANPYELNHALSFLSTDSAPLDPDSPTSEPLGIDPLTCDDEPQTWAEALASGDATRWKAGFQEELDSLKSMGVYELVLRTAVPQGSVVQKGRPIFRIK
jgi:hypothetical protein